MDPQANNRKNIASRGSAFGRPPGTRSRPKLTILHLICVRSVDQLGGGRRAAGRCVCLFCVASGACHREHVFDVASDRVGCKSNRAAKNWPLTGKKKEMKNETKTLHKWPVTSIHPRAKWLVWRLACRRTRQIRSFITLSSGTPCWMDGGKERTNKRDILTQKNTIASRPTGTGHLSIARAVRDHREMTARSEPTGTKKEAYPTLT